MGASILTSVKKVCGIPESDESFDLDILMHINSILSVLDQLGVGPQGGFAIEDAASTWDEFLDDDPRLNLVKTYMCLRVRLLFDPPATSYLIEAHEAQIRELESRINMYREEEHWTAPVSATV